MNKPIVKLLGEDGNAFSILGRCKCASIEAGWTTEQWGEFKSNATSGDYDHLLATVMEYFEEGHEDNVDGDREECMDCGFELGRNGNCPECDRLRETERKTGA